MKRVRYYLKLSTWAGWDPRAHHYYATVSWEDAKDYHHERLEHEVPDECIFCKGKKCDFCDNNGWVPYKTERFDTKEEAIKFTADWFGKNAPKGSVLLEGEGCYMEPLRVIVGPEKVLRAANRVWKKAQAHWEKHGPHGRAWDRMCAEWEKIVGPKKTS